MSAKSAPKKSMSAVLLDRWGHVSQKFAELAQEVPAEKLGWTPVNGLRNCGDVLRHVAFWNQYVTASLRGQQFDDDANQLPAVDYPTKEKTLAVLRSSANEAAIALREHRGDLTPDSMELVTTFIEHTSEHYGQLAVYARLMGIVPPASRT